MCKECRLRRHKNTSDVLLSCSHVIPLITVSMVRYMLCLPTHSTSVILYFNDFRALSGEAILKTVSSEERS